MSYTNHSEITFQTIVEATPNAILLVNHLGRIEYSNNQTERLFGYTKTELIGQLVEILIPERFHRHHPEFRTLFFSSPETRAMGSGRELFASRKDKSEFPVEIGLNPLATVEGSLVLVSIIDITTRKKAEERFRMVVESAPNAMILANREGIITLINKQTEQLFGYARKELIGSKLEVLIPERFRGEHPEHRSQFFSSPSVRAMGVGRELFAARKDGSEFPVEIGLNPIDTDEGTVVLASVIDITERKKHQMLLSLELKNKELEHFNYIASHDLQEPLRTVSNYIQILDEDFSDQFSEEARRHLATIDKATKRMSVLVRSLLEYSRLGRKQKVLKVDCNILLSTVVADLNSLIQATRTSITLGELPVINGYEIELRQLFQNLITNAIKFRKPGIDPEISIGYKADNQHFEFFVSDNGIGISSIHFERIFHIFQRLNNEHDDGGYGIGLANCKKIVEIHGGKIWVESTPGEGSIFRFTISNLQA